ncbi:MAG: carboxylate--amine ligase, partial [Halobacteriaceae archaeon]
MTLQDVDELSEEIERADLDRPPAFVSNAHITGLAVARALNEKNVPVVVLDHEGTGVAPPSNAVSFSGRVT